MNNWLQQSTLRSPELHSNCICLKQCTNTSRIIVCDLSDSIYLWQVCTTHVRTLCPKTIHCYCTLHTSQQSKILKDKQGKMSKEWLNKCLLFLSNGSLFLIPNDFNLTRINAKLQITFPSLDCWTRC